VEVYQMNAQPATPSHMPGPSPFRGHPADAQRGQLLALAPSPSQMKLAGGGVLAMVVGGLAGYWLAERRAQKRASESRRATDMVAAAVELMPVLMRLMANPLVRAMVLRMVMRQISRRLPA
jgi:hypothetical protein